MLLGVQRITQQITTAEEKGMVVNNRLNEWAAQTARNLIEGWVLQMMGTVILGGSRPVGGCDRQPNASSHWYPGQAKYSISGHAYNTMALGAALAETLPMPRGVKPLLYAFALLPGLSRIHTKHHYPSQVFLGWALGYATATHKRTALLELATHGRVTAYSK